MSNKQRNCKYIEYEVNVTEVPVFDNDTKTSTYNFISAKAQHIDFNKLTEEVIKNNPNAQIPFVITFTDKW